VLEETNNTLTLPLACLLANPSQPPERITMLLETPSNAESTTLELLETQFPTLALTAHTLAKMELEFVEELPLPPLEPPPLVLPLPLLLPSSWLLP
jgi:hypothetical protein